MSEDDNSVNNDQPRKISAAAWRLFSLVLVLGVAGIAFTMLSGFGLYDTSALYLGLPLLLALGLSLTPKTKSAMGATMKGITIALLLAALIFGEGYICILFAAPIFYIVGAVIAYCVDQARRRKDQKSRLQTASVATLIALLSLEGTTAATTWPREATSTASNIVNASIGDVRRQLTEPVHFSGAKPLFLKIFPYPVDVSGQGSRVNDEWRAHFIAYKHIWWNKVEGNLTLKLTESTPTHLKFAVTCDDSYLSHYLKWQSSEVFLQPLDAMHTKVTWVLSYQRSLDPSWYFGPLQSYAVHLAARELIDHVATPAL